MLIKIDKNFDNNSEALKTLIEQIYYINSSIIRCQYVDKGLKIDFELDYTENTNYLINEVHNLASSILKSFDRVEARIIFENIGEVCSHKDPIEYLMKTNQVIETYPGVFALQGDFLNCINEIDSVFRSFAMERDAVEQHFQPTLPTKSLVENGYLSSFPQHPLFVSSVQRNADIINTLSNDAKVKPIKDIHEWLEDKLDHHTQILSPTVCYHCFETLRGRSIPAQGVQYTAIASCHRHESLNISGLSRLQTFTMREIVFYGTDEFVETCRNEILSHCQSYFVNLGLKFRVITASDPFFASGAEKKRIFQSALELKYEVQAYLPHSDSWISVASFNNHQQSLVSKYNISFESMSLLHSGCVGYGYERLAYAMYSQFGYDRSAWPRNNKYKNEI